MYSSHSLFAECLGAQKALLRVGSPEASMVENGSTVAASEQEYAQNQVRFRIGCA